MTPLPPDPDHFRDKPAEYAAWAARHFTAPPAWCARHWAPCPVEGRNGIAATLELTQRSLDRIPRDVRRRGASAMNSYMANWSPPMCCWLGDEEMAKVWAGVP
jgi:hypothetical protein